MKVKISKQELINLGVDEITAKKFFDYHKANPIIFEEFEKLAISRIANGKTKLSAKGIFEDVRELPNIKKTGTYKITNSFISYYARIFAIKHKHLAHYFEFKSVRGLKCKLQDELDTIKEPKQFNLKWE